MNLFELNREFENCDCGKEHKCPVKHIKIGRGVLGELCELCSGYSEILFVFDENTRRVCGERVVELLASKKSREIVVSAPAGDVVIPNEDAIAEIERELTDTTDLIVGVGSGVINDLCKYVSFMHDLPYFIVATAPSMDGYASNGAAMILSGMKVTVSTRPPLAIIGDTEILKDAPLDIPSGAAHLLSLLVAAFIWLDDDAEKAQYYMALYRDGLAAYKYRQLSQRDKKYHTNGWA